MTGPLVERATAVYLYAVCSGRVPSAVLDEIRGHRGGGPVRTLPLGALTALVQDVPAAEFEAERLRERLSDRSELESAARTHHEVVARAAGCVDTLPLPMATLYRTEESLQDALRAGTARFRAALARIAGREEWGVKVYAAPRPAPEPATSGGRRTEAGAAVASPSGRAYLDRVRNRHQARQARADTALRSADRVEAELRRTTVAVRRLRTHGPEVSGRSRSQLLNAACLLPRGREASLRGALARLGEAEGVDIEVTGPWVPYSFVEPEGAEPEGAEAEGAGAGGGRAR